MTRSGPRRAAAALRRRALRAEAACALLLARLARVLPARVYLPAPSPAGAAGPAARPRLGAEIGHAVETAAARLPVGTGCLERALAARWMLARRGRPSVLHLGLARDGAVRAAPHRGLAAHAWLTLGGEVVVGGAGLDRYAAVARFS